MLLVGGPERRRGDGGRRAQQPTTRRSHPHPAAVHLGPPRRSRLGEPLSASITGRWSSVDGLLTPRQACPREGPSGATCVQRLDGSRDSAIHTTYRISLRSSSMREPRYPLPRVILFPWPRRTAVRLGKSVFLGDIQRRVPAPGRGRGRRGRGGWLLPGGFTLRVHRSCSLKATTMILPQVHLRKPCYDFYFL